MEESKIKIAVGIDSLSDIKPLIDAGADEFFCGVLAKQRLNVRSNTSQFNFNNLKELKKAIQICHSYSKEIWLTLNVNMLTGPMLEEAMDLFRKVAQLKIDGIILADVMFLSEISSMRPNVKLAISTLLPKLNLESINFLKPFKFNRLIMDRQITFKEIQTIDKNIKNIELEIFALPRCRYVCAFCKYEETTGLPHYGPQRRKYMCPCSSPLNIKAIPFLNKNIEKLITSNVKKNLFKKDDEVRFSLSESEALNLFYFNKLRNKLIFKVDTRGDHLSDKIFCIKFLREALNFLFNNQPSHKAYIKWIHERFLP